MPQFRKKPVVIEAEQWNGPEDDIDGVYRRKTTNGTFYVVPTLEGDMRVTPGDWIITGVQGERYPCKPDIFAATYEPA